MRHLVICVILLVLPCFSSCEDRTVKDPSGLEESNSHVRRNTAFWFGESGRGDAIEVLSKSLQGDSDHTVRAASAESLGKCGNATAEPALNAALADDHQLVRAFSINALVSLQLKSSAAAIEKLLTEDPDAEVRSAAAKAMGAFKYQTATKSLLGVLNDSDSRVRYSAMAALGRITNKQYGKDVSAWQAWGRSTQ